MQEIDRTRKEFHIEGRILHRAQFPSVTGRANVQGTANVQVAPLKANQFPDDDGAVRGAIQYGGL